MSNPGRGSDSPQRVAHLPRLTGSRKKSHDERAPSRAVREMHRRPLILRCAGSLSALFAFVLWSSSLQAAPEPGAPTPGPTAPTGAPGGPGSSGTPAGTPEPKPTAPADPPGPALVLCQGKPVATLRADVASVTAAERAQLATEKLARLVAARAEPAGLVVRAGTGGATILHGTIALLVLLPGDAKLPLERGPDVLESIATCLKDAAAAPKTADAKQPAAPEKTRDLLYWLERIRERAGQQDFQTLATRVGIVIAALVGIPLVIILLGRIFRRSYIFVARVVNARMRPLRVRGVELLLPSTVTAWAVGLLAMLRLLLSLLAVYAGFRYGLEFADPQIQTLVLPLVRGALNTILATYAALLLFRGLESATTALLNRVERSRGSLLTAIQVRNVELLSESQVVEAVQMVVRILRLATIAFFAYLWITVVFSFFTFSAGWADQLLGYVLGPLGAIGRGIVGYVPNLFFIAIAVLAARFVIRFLRVFFDGIERGRTSLPGFHADWAGPTYKIVSFVLIAFVAVLVFPYLPGAQSDAFKGVGLFLGFLLSLGSTAVVANMVAGIVLTYMRPFMVGDRVKIADTVGDVVQKTILVTRIRTVKNIEVTIPNGLVLGSHITNYSTNAKDTGLILHTSVTIGYDIPWRDVHRLLKESAQKTEGIMEQPEPFVLQTELSDFYVAYELNCYSREPARMARIYSELHGHIQDLFNEAGVEILSPHYRAQRDGNTTTIPGSYLPSDYQPPGFRIEDTRK